MSKYFLFLFFAFSVSGVEPSASSIWEWTLGHIPFLTKTIFFLTPPPKIPKPSVWQLPQPMVASWLLWQPLRVAEPVVLGSMTRAPCPVLHRKGQCSIHLSLSHQLKSREKENSRKVKSLSSKGLKNLPAQECAAFSQVEDAVAVSWVRGALANPLIGSPALQSSKSEGHPPPQPSGTNLL